MQSSDKSGCAMWELDLPKTEYQICWHRGGSNSANGVPAQTMRLQMPRIEVKPSRDLGLG